MKIVGDHLAAHAVGSSDMTERDLFARSAFNRLYYAVFLESRALLAETVQKNPPHKKFPETLQRLGRQISVELERLARAHAITHAERKKLEHAARAALTNLSRLIEDAYAIRVIADYFPDTPVDDSGGTIRLRGTSINTAKHWPVQAKLLCDQVRNVWRRTGR